MKAEILIKDITHPRISIAPNRFVIKFPETFEDKDRIIKFAHEIQEKLQGQIKFGLHGQFIKLHRFDFYKVGLHARKNRGTSHNRTFKEGATMEVILPEIIIEDVFCPKLTLTPSRMTIKFPKTFVDKDRIVKFANRIKEHLTNKVSQSLRGRFLLENGIYSIALQIKGKDSGNETVYNFKEGGV